MADDPLIARFIEDLRRKRAAEGDQPSSVLAWAERHRRINGRPFNLDRFSPLRAIYEDDHDWSVCMKPAQRGVSEYLVNLACFALEQGARCWLGRPEAGVNVGYVFPHKRQLEDFAKERINGLREESTHLKMLFGDDSYDSLGFKKVGPSYLYLRGTYAVADLLSFAADLLILDEYDTMDTRAVALARRRLSASEIRRQVQVSTPTFPGRGIHAAYMQSDQRVYLTPCPICHAENTYDFFRDVRVDNEPYETWRMFTSERIAVADVTLHCPACGAPQDETDRCAPGRWEAQRPEAARIHGYHIPWWAFPMVDLQSFAHSAVSDDPQERTELYRSDLGIPHSEEGSSVSADMLEHLSLWQEQPDGARLRLPQAGWRDVTMGADIGAVHHYRVSAIGPEGEHYVRAMGTAESFAELDHLMLRYQVRHAVIDALPAQEQAIAFCEKWKGRARRAFYPTGATALRGVLFVAKEGEDIVRINRTLAMDTVRARIAALRERWPAEIARDPEVIAHLGAPTRVETEDEHGQVRPDWVHTMPDHFYHACLVAGTPVETEHGPVAIERVQPGDRVWTRFGLRRVLAAGMTEQDAPVLACRFTTGAVVRVTGNHPVLSATRGWIPIDRVYDDTLCAWAGRCASHMEARPTTGIPTAHDGLTASITRMVAGPACIGGCGKTPTDPSRRDTTCITPTAILTTTRSAISCACHPTPIGPGTTSHTVHSRNTPATTAVAGSPLSRRRSTTLPDGARARVSRPSADVPEPTMSTEPACSAADHSASIATAGPGRALVSAASVSAVRLLSREPGGRAPVFNLSVEGDHEYFASGVLWHNCVYDTIARESLPAHAEFAAAVGGERPLFERYQKVVGEREYVPISRHGSLPPPDPSRY